MREECSRRRQDHDGSRIRTPHIHNGGPSRGSVPCKPDTAGSCMPGLYIPHEYRPVRLCTQCTEPTGRRAMNASCIRFTAFSCRAADIYKLFQPDHAGTVCDGEVHDGPADLAVLILHPPLSFVVELFDGAGPFCFAKLQRRALNFWSMYLFRRSSPKKRTFSVSSTATAGHLRPRFVPMASATSVCCNEISTLT